MLVSGARISFAQEHDNNKNSKDRLTEIEQMTVAAKKHKSTGKENDIFKINAVSHAGYGWIMVDGEAFRGKFGPSYEIFINTFNLSFTPASFISLNAGLDLKWNRFISTTDMFTVTGGEFSGAATTPDDIRSKLCGFSLSVPAMLSFNMGDTHLRVGAEASFNISGYNKVKSSYTDSDAAYTQVIKGGEFAKTAIGYLASINFYAFGVYYKYCPKAMIPGSDLIKNYQTIGIVLSM